LGGSSESQISGKLSRTGYQLDVQGPASIARLFQLARAVGVTAPASNVTGYAFTDIALYGDWKNFSPAQVQGHADLIKTVIPLKGITEPALIEAATLSFDPERVQIHNLDATFKKSKLAIHGDITAERRCPDRLLCNFEFTLHTPELDSESLTRLIVPAQTISLPFLSFRRSTPDWLLALAGNGTISATHLRIKQLEARNVFADVTLAANRTRLENVEADLLGGRHAGNWTIDFASAKPVVSGSGTVEHINMQLLSTAMKEKWGSGTLDGVYHLSLSGNSGAELVNTATGTASFEWRNGKLVDKSNTQDVFAFTEWNGRLTLRDRVIHLEDNHVRTVSGVQRVNGTINLSRESDLQFERDKGTGFTLQGPLDAPSISESPATASLGLHQ